MITRMNEEKAIEILNKAKYYYNMKRKGYNDVIKWLEGRIKRRSKASYLLFKPEIETADICHNANSTNCKKCFEPECELAGRDKNV